MTDIVLSSENIFYTIQGEGKYVGYPTTFVRLSRCNLRCAWKNTDGSLTLCDTPHTSFNPELLKFGVKEVTEEISGHGAEHVVITGGEPFFQKSVVELISELTLKGHYITVETNGTLYFDNNAQFMSISPKLSTSSMHPELGERHEKNRFNIKNISKMVVNHDYQFKFVVNDRSDIEEIVLMLGEISNYTGIPQDELHEKVWVMPQGISNEQFDEKLEWMAEICKDYKWKLTDRLHIRIWGSKKGV